MFRLLLPLALVALANTTVFAQPYLLETTLQPYVELTDADFAMADDGPYWNGGQVKVTRNLKVPGFGTKYDANKGVFTVIESGYLYFESPSRTFTFYAFRSDLTPRKGADQTSEFSFKLEGVTGSKVLKMQWKNLGLEYGGEDEYANFQVWMYETGVLEVRLGEMNLKPASLQNGDPVIGLLDMNGSFTSIYDEAYLTGSPSSPMLTYASIAGLDGVPPSNTVYRFMPSSLDVHSDPADGKNDAVQIVTRVLTLPQGSEGSQRYVLSNTLGQRVLEGNAKHTMDVSNLAAGIYFLQVANDVGEAAQMRFLKR